MCETGVVLAQSYDREEIFAKRLLALLPFYIMRYEGDFDPIASNDKRTSALIAESDSLEIELTQIAVTKDKALLSERNASSHTQGERPITKGPS